MGNSRFGWHSGAIKCKSLTLGNKDGTGVVDSVNGTRLAQVYLISYAAGGDQRAAYIKLTSAGNGTGVSGEAVRAYHSCTGITGPAHGLHAGIAYATNMYCNNEAIAMRGTVEMPSSTVAQGSYYGVQSEFYTNGASAVLSGTGAAFFRCILTGSEAVAPAALDVNAKMFLFDFSNTSGTNYITAASGGFVDTAKTGSTKSGGLRIKLPNGNTAWIGVFSD